MRSNLVTAAGEGWLSRLQGWLGQDPPDNKRRRGLQPWPCFFTWAQKSAPANHRMPCRTRHRCAACKRPPHVKTNGGQENVARHNPTQLGVTRSGIQARANN